MHYIKALRLAVCVQIFMGVNYRGLLSVGSVGRCVRPGRGVGSVPAVWLRW